VKIRQVEAWRSSVGLTRPYTIASRSIDSVDLFFVRVRSDSGLQGLGSASPAEEVTGESIEACAEALTLDEIGWLQGLDVLQLANHCRRLRSSMAATPAARLAMETALHDLFCRQLEIPLVDLFGRRHTSLPTSITIGIKPTIEEALAEADEYVARGFVCLKVKIGRDLELDLELLAKLRERCGPRVAVRVDANRGYTLEQAARLWPAVDELEIELVEQPVGVDEFENLVDLEPRKRRIVAADESLLDERDALRLLRSPRPCGIFNIKLMKCGGLTTALSISELARIADIDLMWGCMDESAISISAAIHTAFACPQTKFLDLDGSFDLSTDPATGGFELSDGRLRLLEGVGLGVELAE
jgi:L-alanine-DL-glutamate epimerase-like enolase superfamily enzyme